MAVVVVILVVVVLVVVVLEPQQAAAPDSYIPRSLAVTSLSVLPTSSAAPMPASCTAGGRSWRVWWVRT